jgi:hypothetical protein
MRIQDGPLGHLRDVVDQRNAQFMLEIAAAASIRSAKTRPTTRTVAAAPPSTPKMYAPGEGITNAHVDTVA